MRALPVAALLAVSLVFSVGGVALRSRADAQNAPDQSRDSSQAMSVLSSDPTPSAQTDIPQCKPRFPRHEPMHIQPVASGKDFVPLNTRGYNYALPGEMQYDPTGHPVEPRAPKSPASAPVPAAPAH
jgi:hypothetical protein